MTFKITWLTGTDRRDTAEVESSDILQAINTLCQLRDVEPSEIVGARCLG